MATSMDKVSILVIKLYGMRASLGVAWLAIVSSAADEISARSDPWPL